MSDVLYSKSEQSHVIGCNRPTIKCKQLRKQAKADGVTADDDPITGFLSKESS